MIPHRLYVGTIGEGLWHSLDGGVSFNAPATACSSSATCIWQSIRDQRVLYLGSEQGLFRSDDGADNWRRVIRRSTASNLVDPPFAGNARCHPGRHVPFPAISLGRRGTHLD